MKNRWLRSGLLAALDQAWLSLLSLAISFVFIRYADKVEYGIYLLLLTPVALMQSMQSALLTAPFATLYPGESPERQQGFMRTLVRGQGLLICLAAVAGLLGMFVFSRDIGETWSVWLAFAFAAGLAGLLARDAVRAAQYALGRTSTAFCGDFLYGLTLLAGLAAFTAWADLSAAAVFALCGLAGLLPLAWIKRSTGTRAMPGEWPAFWACGRWSLLGAVLSWANLNAYHWAAGMAFGLAAVAEINAARLFLMPFALGITAWSNLARPHISRWFRESRLHEIRRLSLLSCVAGAVLLSAYMALLLVVYPFIEELLGESYTGLRELVLLWAVYYLITQARNICMASLMVNPEGYRRLSFFSIVGFVLLLPAMAVASLNDRESIVIALILVEFLVSLPVFLHAQRQWKG